MFTISVINTSFFKNLKFGNNVTNNDVISSKINLFIPALENQLVFKFGSFTAFGLAVEQLRLFDTRWQTVKAEKGESLRSKTRGLLLVAQAMVLSHRARFQLIIDFFRVSMHFVFLWNYFWTCSRNFYQRPHTPQSMHLPLFYLPIKTNVNEGVVEGSRLGKKCRKCSHSVADLKVGHLCNSVKKLCFLYLARTIF